MNTFFLNVDCVGEVTKRRYVGQVEVKLWLNHKEMGDVARDTNKSVQGLQRTPQWDISGFIAGLQDKWEGIADADKLNLTEMQISRIMAMVSLSCPIGDPSADILSTIALLNGHIVTSPDWWNNGSNLIDYAPVVEIHKQLRELQAEQSKSVDKSEKKG